MKKFAFSLIACLVLVQSAFAATSALTESLLEYEAIITAIGTDTDFDPLEFVVDIKRITERIDVLGTVKYRIVTRTVGEENHDRRCGHCATLGHRIQNYIATLHITANPAIGPNIIEVVSIDPVHHH